jgi:FtsP/CotA-like multicopper oxidase with cupredoxin domain
MAKVLIPPNRFGAPGRVVMRTRVERYIGRFVLHCHILGHEDRGMMQLVEIVPPGG